VAMATPIGRGFGGPSEEFVVCLNVQPALAPEMTRPDESRAAGKLLHVEVLRMQNTLAVTIPDSNLRSSYD
jgi:hypothetical protein